MQTTNTTVQQKTSAYQLDPEIRKILESLGGPASLPAARGDWQAMREAGNTAMQQMANNANLYSDVNVKKFNTNAPDGQNVSLKLFYKTGAQPGSAVVYAHGGSLIMGSVALFHELIALHVSATGVPFLAVEYRKAPDEGMGMIPATDVFTGLCWLAKNGASLHINPERIAVMGHSAGGTLAAAAAILARDKQLKLAKQILIYPMLDDRNTDKGLDNPIERFLTFSHNNSYTGWKALLGDQLGKDDVSPFAAPARLKHFEELAPAYVEIGELDIFRNETIAYVQELSAANVPVEFHLYPGAPHGFDSFPTMLTERVLADRFRVIRSL